jgi:hypothetical protein
LRLLPKLRTLHFGEKAVQLVDGRPGDFANHFFEYLEKAGNDSRLDNSETGPAHPRSFEKRLYYKRAKKLCDGTWRAVAVSVSVKLSWLQDNETELDVLDYDTRQAWPAGFPACQREV